MRRSGEAQWLVVLLCNGGCTRRRDGRCSRAEVGVVVAHGRELAAGTRRAVVWVVVEGGRQDRSGGERWLTSISSPPRIGKRDTVA